MFTNVQVEGITSALNAAITNVLSMFVTLLPVVATIAGVSFGIMLVRSLFKKVGRGRN